MIIWNGGYIYWDKIIIMQDIWLLTDVYRYSASYVKICKVVNNIANVHFNQLTSNLELEQSKFTHKKIFSMFGKKGFELFSYTVKKIY